MDTLLNLLQIPREGGVKWPYACKKLPYFSEQQYNYEPYLTKWSIVALANNDTSGDLLTLSHIQQICSRRLLTLIYKNVKNLHKFEQISSFVTLFSKDVCFRGVRKRMYAQNEQFDLLPQCFQLFSLIVPLFIEISLPFFFKVICCRFVVICEKG